MRWRTARRACGWARSEILSTALAAGAAGGARRVLQGYSRAPALAAAASGLHRGVRARLLLTGGSPTPCADGLRTDPAAGRQRGSIRARLLVCVGPLCGLDWMRVCAVGGCQGQRGEAACGAVADRSRVAPRHQMRGLHGTGLAPRASAPGTGLTPPTSAPEVGSPRPHLHRDWAHPTPHLRRD